MQSTTYKAKFYVIETKVGSIIIRMPFLFKNTCVFDFAEGTIKVDKQDFELSSKFHLDPLEKEFMNKSSINTVQETILLIKKLVSGAKKNNPPSI